MNKIYKVVWNAARGCYVVGSELMKTHQGKKKSREGVISRSAMALLTGLAGWGAAANIIYADVTVADPSKYGNTVRQNGNVFDVMNQQVKDKNALNRFDRFSLTENQMANLHMGDAERQINIVNQRMDVNGVVNAIKDNKIGGDVYFFSDKGIAVGAKGVFNVGSLTLGTNAKAGEKLFDEGFGEYDGKTGTAKAKYIAGSGAISVKGTINTDGDVILGTKKDLTLDGASIKTHRDLASVNVESSFSDMRKQVMNLPEKGSADAAKALGNGDVVLYTEDNASVSGGKIMSAGGNVTVSAVSSDAKLQADPEEKPADGMISIKNAYIDSSSDKRDSGKIEVSAARDVMGVSRVEVDGSTLDASGKGGHHSGDVAVHATAATQLYAWDIGDGAYAQVHMGKDKDVSGRNTITADNVDIAAYATTTGDIGQSNESKTEAELEAKVQNAGEEGTALSLLKDMGGNLRAVVQATKIKAGADVDIEKTDMAALGGGKDESASHGNISILSNARSAIQPMTIGAVGYGVNVGISDVDSHVHVDHSSLYAAKDTDISAVGDNKVSMSLIELNFLDDKVRSTVDFTWAELNSRVSAVVGENATITSKEDASVKASSTRTLSSSVSNGGDTNVIGIAASVAMADTKAEAEMNGTVYAGGDVTVEADNSIAKSESGVYQADTSKASSMSGESGLAPTVNAVKDKGGQAAGKVKDGAVWIYEKIKSLVADKGEDEGIELDDLDVDEEKNPEQAAEAKKKPWNKLGLNGATAILLSGNDANASVTGKVRGISDSPVDGKYRGNDAKGAGSLTVKAENIARTSAKSAAFQAPPAKETGADDKQVTVSAAVTYTAQKNHSTAFISGDTKTEGDTKVTAETKIPWQTKLTGTGMAEIGMNAVFIAIDGTGQELPSYLVDSWTQTSGSGEKANGAASIAVVNYDNSAKAFIGKKDDAQREAPKVEAGGNVDVNGTTDITTVNFTGSVKNLLNKAPVNVWSGRRNEIFNKKDWDPNEASNTGIGGAALAVRQKNNAEAYIDGGAEVTSGKDTNVTARTEAFNLAMTAAGGMAKSLAIDGTVGVNRIDNSTKAYLGKGTITSGKDVNISASDDSVDVNLAGAVGAGEGSGIGATIGYNHIIRDTEACVTGNMDAEGDMTVHAENTGEIIAASAAGAVTYEGKGTSAVNGGGSSGFHTPDAEEESEDGGGLEGLADSMAGETTNLASSADSTISKAASQDSSMKDNAGKAKGGLAASANVAVNRIHDTSRAYVKKDGEEPVISGGALSVTSSNDSSIIATAAAISASFSSQNTHALAGSFMYNSITGVNEAYVEGADMTLTGSKKKDRDESLAVEAENKETITNVAASGSYTPKGNAVAGQVSLNWVDDENRAWVKDSSLKADEVVSISSKNNGKIGSYTGAVAAATGGSGASGNAVGAAINVNLMEGDTTAFLENTEVKGASSGSAGKTAVTAEEKSHITSIVASGAAANNFGGAFSASGNWIHTAADAHVENNKSMEAESLAVEAGKHSTSTLGVGSAAIGNQAAGASIGVMVNDSTVKASLAGSEDHVISGGGITVKADNAYNGSASDSESDSTAKNVAVGFAGGAAQFGGSGSVTVNVIRQTTDASLGKGRYDAGSGKVDVEAITKANLFGLAGGVSVSGGTGIGAAVDVEHYTGHTYAGLEDGADIIDGAGVIVNADSSENMTSIAATLAGGSSFGGAGAAGAHSITTDTGAYMGSGKGSKGAKAVVKGTVDVKAKDTTKLTTAAGSGGIGESAGVGLTAAVEVVDKNVTASVGKNSKVNAAGLSVSVENTSDSVTFAAGLGAGGTAGVAGAASETFVTHTTKAFVDDGADVTVNSRPGRADDGRALIKAASSFTQGSGAGSLGASGTVGAGLANATVSLNADTEAYAGNGAKVKADDIAIDASHKTDITYATIAGGVGGNAGLSGSIGVNVLDTETKAYTGNDAALTAAAKDITLSAEDTTKLHGGNGGAVIGINGGGAGAAVAATVVKKDTETYAGKNAKLDSRGKVTLSSDNKENLLNVSIQASGGLYAGLAGAANSTVLHATTKAFTDTGVSINTGEDYRNGGGDVSLAATHEIERMDSTAAGAAAGAGSIGAGVDVGVVRTQTNAYLGDGNTVHTKGSVSVKAHDNMHDIATRPLAASIGGVGLSGSISVYSFGGALSDDDKAALKGKTSENGEEMGFDDWTDSQINDSSTAAAMGAYDSEALSHVKAKLGTSFSSKAPSSTGEAGTLSKVGSGTSISAGGSVTVEADDTLSVTNTMGNLSAGAAAAGTSVSVVTGDKDVKALVDRAASIRAAGDVTVKADSSHRLSSAMVGASVSGGVSIQGTEETWKDTARVAALLGDTNGIHGKNISITSNNTHDLNSLLTGASVALSGALNGAVITADVSGTSEAGVGGNGTYDKEVKADEDVTISADAHTRLGAKAVGAAVGVYAGAGTGVKLSSDVDTKAFTGKGEKIFGKNISITSHNTPVLDNLAVSAGLGLAGVGVTVAENESKDDSRVLIGESTVLAAEKKVDVSSSMSRPDGSMKEEKGKYNSFARAIAGAGGVVAGSAAITGATMNHETETEVGAHAKITGGTVSISASHDDVANVEMETAAAGMYSGTGGDMRTNMTSGVKVTLKDGVSIVSSDDTKVLAENRSEKNWLDGKDHKNGISGGASLAGGSGIVNHTSITHTTKVDMGKVTVSGNGAALSADEKAKGLTEYDKKGIAVDAKSTIISRDYNTIATGSAVSAAHVKNTTEAKADTDVTVAEGASFKAGGTDEASREYNDRDFTANGSGSRASSYRGGSIAFGSRNDADISSYTMVDVFGAAGYAGSTNDVTYIGHADTSFNGSAETARGDIRTAAGRDSSGNTGTLRAQGTSDILNATAIPISIAGDPEVTVESHADLTLGEKASLKSDRDVYLESQAGYAAALASGEVKDWVNKLAEAFGSDGYKLGKAHENTSSAANISGSVETGIHRDRHISFWGVPEKDKDGNLTGNWILYTDRNGDISYTVSGSVPVGTDLYRRLDELDGLKGDDAAMAAYDAERKFIQSKLVEQGLGYYQGTTFVRLPVNDPSEYDDMAGKMKDGSSYLASRADLKAMYTDAKRESEDQSRALSSVQTSYDSWKDAAAAESRAQSSYDRALTVKNEKETDLASREAAVDSVRGSESLEDYVKAHGDEKVVKSYLFAKSAYDSAAGSAKDAASALETAKGKTLSAASSYKERAKSYDTVYLSSFSTDPTAALGERLKTEADELAKEQKLYSDSISAMDSDISYKKNQLKATDDFFAKGGKEVNGQFVTASGTVIDGNEYAYEGGSYVLLHKTAYNRLTHEINVGSVTSRLGDIHLEGDTIYGTGSLKASGDGKVTITNNTPYNLYVNDVTVAGKGSTEGVGRGGMIYRSGSALSSSSASGILKEINDKNRDKTKSASFTGVVTRNLSAKPEVTIRNTFAPQSKEYMAGKESVFSAPSLHTKGVVYNPRGAVSVTSTSGDVYNEGSINGAAISVTANNGDYIQSYNPNYRISNMGGTPLDDAGNLQSADGMGILANGNIYISARYVNINSTIQSGVAEWKYTIPADFTLYYRDADGKVHGGLSAADAKALSGSHTFYVADKDGNAINRNGDRSASDSTGERLTYDVETDRFVLSNVEVRGGHVSIVGTIINTARSGAAKGNIKALDGYGTITVDNRSGKDLELRALSTGDGVEGTIEITDLDKSSGAVRQKVVYTRRADGIYQSVNGADPVKVTGESSTSYATDSHMYYSYQTGRDWSVTNRYEYHGTRNDWFGIQNEQPTKDELLAIGGKLVASNPGVERPLNGGYYVSTTNDVNKTDTGEYYHTSERTIENGNARYSWDIKSKRLWYTLGLAKKWDVVMTEDLSKNTVKQYSVKADYPVGIEFFGNQEGGSLSVSGNTGSLYIEGVLNNKGGSTSLSGKDIIQGSAGFIDTKSLSLTASGSAGKGNGIRTAAETVDGSAGDTFAVNVSDHGVTLGGVTAGKLASITAADGISQKEESIVKSDRIELSAGNGAISGKGGAFHVETGSPEGGAADSRYGLKAAAAGDIAITNTSGDLYLDSVTSDKGNVTLTTSGSFIDNNFTDRDNENAREKLEGWARKAVLENSSETISKQKTLLINKVEAKYNEYLALSSHVKDGVYILDGAEKTSLAASGITDLDAYAAEKQARYEELKKTAGTWTKEGVAAYIKSIEGSSDTNLYGNAALKAESLAGDTCLTAAEKAEALVGSAKSAKDLLVTFAPGGIKEGITDTNATIKGTPHVSGKNVTLTALGDGTMGSGSIGEKKTGITVDLSKDNIPNLTSEELLALAAAERGDFKVSGDKVTVSTVRPIDTKAGGILTAKADKGALYITSQEGIHEGSTIEAGGEVRLKTKGAITGADVKAGDQVVLESAGGAISDVTLKGSGVVTARAEKGVEINKEGDLVIHTLYASDGDVAVHITEGSVYAEEGNDEEGNEQGTTFVNVEGKNISITGADSILGEKGNAGSLGMKAMGGAIRAEVKDRADITVFGNPEDSETKISARDLALTSRGDIKAGTFSGSETLTVYNAGKVWGGTFRGGDVSLTNGGTLSGGSFTAGGNMTMVNRKDGVMENGSFAGNDLAFTNKGKAAGGSYKADASMNLANEGSLEKGTFESEGTLDMANSGTVGRSSLTAERDLTYSDRETGAIMDSSLTSKTGKVILGGKAPLLGRVENVAISAAHDIAMNAKSDITLTFVKGSDVSLTTGGNLTVDKAETTEGSLTLDAGEKLTAKTLTSTSGLTAKSGTDMEVETMNAKGAAELTAKENLSLTKGKAASLTMKSGRGMTVGEAETTDGDLALDAGEKLTAKTLTSTSGLTAKSGTDMEVETMNAKGAAELTAKENLSLTKGKAASLTMKSGRGMTVGEAETTDGDLALDAGEKLTAKTLTSTSGLNLTSGNDMDVDYFTAWEEAKLESGDNIRLKEGRAGDVFMDAGRNLFVEDTLQARMGSASLKAAEDANIHSLTAHKNVDLLSGGNAFIESVETKEGDAAFTSETGDLEVLESQIAGALLMKAGRNIRLSRSHSVKLSMKAGESMETKGENALISTGDADMEAGETIRISSRSPVMKMEGVDTERFPSVLTGSGDAGSILTAEAKGTDFDPSGKGSARLETDTGRVKISAKIVEMDTLFTAGAADIEMKADYAGVDDMSAGKGTALTLTGFSGRQTGYGGFHTTTAPFLLKDSFVENLYLTGIDDLSLWNTTLGGDSRLATSFMTFTVRKNGGALGEHMGSLTLHGYDIATGERLGDVRNGITINGSYFTPTGTSVMYRSIYQDNELGDDGREKEKSDDRDHYQEIGFAPAAESEDYVVLMK
ncbi:leukotoxin LktA family filamentous adhesin [uncultured Dialister sp.]|uniref:leukotoxin LktA family filamentous adhesin n=1 Tax=uncultured Dialister sp. TaxID=278064 RepID=UPI0026183371|nr:leukotoxin LktA family filamentous adhesin [uncultured Dialister sp.]